MLQSKKNTILDKQPMFQKFKIDNLEQFPKNLDALLNRQRETINDITTNAEINYEKVLKPLQDLDEELGLFFTPLSHLNSVMNSEETQKAYEESIPLLSKFHSEMAQNTALFNKIEQIQTSDDEAKTVVSHEVRDFVLSGVKLPEEKKKRMEEISLKLSELSNQFSQNLLDATNAYELIIENEKDVEGMQESDLDAAKEEIDGKTVYKFTLQTPSYLAYMTYGPNREYRKELSKAYATRAPENTGVIDKILALKYEKSQLLGFSSYAHYALETRDANHEDDVITFLNELADAALPQAKNELDELKSFALKTDGIEELKGYDVGFYSEKLKKEIGDDAFNGLAALADLLSADGLTAASDAPNANPLTPRQPHFAPKTAHGGRESVSAVPRRRCPSDTKERRPCHSGL